MIKFKALTVDDAEELLSIRDDKKVSDLYIGNIFPNSLEIEKEWIKSLPKKEPNNIVYGIYLEKIIGVIQFKNINYINRNCEISIFISSNSHGKGYGKKSMNFIKNYVFNVLGLKKAYLYVLEENSQAIKLYSNFGFNVVGTLKNHIFRNGYYKNLLLMESINE